jgi:hypothetical protein
MTISIYDTVELIEIVRNLKTPSSWLLDTFFPNVQEFDTKEVAIDVDAGKRRIAPFVSPLVSGKIVESRGVATSSFAPAYIKDKRVLDVMRPISRAIGEKIGGTMSPMQREAANIAFEMQDQIQMVDRRLEWMAANALRTGTITISGDGYPTQVVNFNRDSTLTIALVSGAVWSTANISGGTVSPSGNLDTWSMQVLQKSGAVVTDVVFTPSAWNLFVQDKRVQNAIWFDRAGGSTIQLGGGVAVGAILKGNFGNYRLWLYNDWYVDPVTDVEYPMIADGTVILGSSQVMGIRAFGAIIDPEHAYTAMAYAPKSWIEKDPGVRMLLMQSAPIVIPARVNASMAATVY